MRVSFVSSKLIQFSVLSFLSFFRFYRNSCRNLLESRTVKFLANQGEYTIPVRFDVAIKTREVLLWHCVVGLLINCVDGPLDDIGATFKFQLVELLQFRFAPNQWDSRWFGHSPLGHFYVMERALAALNNFGVPCHVLDNSNSKGHDISFSKTI